MSARRHRSELPQTGRAIPARGARRPLRQCQRGLHLHDGGRTAAPVYHVVTPFALDDGRVLLVDRGLVPPRSCANPRSAAGEFAGRRAACRRRLARRRMRPGLFTPAPDLTHRIWYSRDLTGIAKADWRSRPPRRSSSKPMRRPIPAAGRKADRPSSICRTTTCNMRSRGLRSRPVSCVVYLAYHRAQGRLGFQAIESHALHQHARRDRAAILRGCPARRGWRPTAGFFMPEAGRAYRRAEIASFATRVLCGCGVSHSVAICRRVFLRGRTEGTISTRPMPRSMRPMLRRWSRSGPSSICSSCFTGPRSRSRTSRCRCWAGCLRARWRSGAAKAPFWRRRQATRARPPSRLFGGLPNIEVVRAPSERPRQRSAAPADDDGRSRQRPQHRARRQLRRRAGDRERPVRRHAISRAASHLTAVNSINFARIAAQCVYYFTAAAQASAVRASLCRADGKFRRRVRRRSCDAHGARHRRTRRRHQCQRHPGARANEGVYAAGDAQADAQPVHGHPGREQFRARAVRGVGPRRRLGARRRWMRSHVSRQSQICRTPSSTALRARYRPSPCDDAETLATIGRDPCADRPARRTRTRRWGWRRRLAQRPDRRTRWSFCRLPTRQNSRKPLPGRPAFPPLAAAPPGPL